MIHYYNMTNTIQLYWWSLLIFVIFKSVFDLFQSLTTYKAQTIILGLFSVVFFVFLLAINVAYTENDFICGKRNVSLAAYSTIFPYIFIYMLGMLMIQIFPGWLRGFSNTFGLTVIRMCGFDEKDYLQDNNAKSDNIVNQIYENPTPLFNEIVDYPTEISGNGIPNWPNIENINFKEDMKPKLLGYMLIKDNVANYLWVALLSSITILVSENILLSESCNPDPKDDDQFQKYLATQLKE